MIEAMELAGYAVTFDADDERWRATMPDSGPMCAADLQRMTL